MASLLGTTGVVDKLSVSVNETSAKFFPRQQQVQNFPQLVIKFILKIFVLINGCGFESQLAGH